LDSPDDSIAATIAALEAQRGVLGDAVVDRAIASLRLAVPEAAIGEDDARKRTNVAILFADLVGSTALSRRVDLEDVQRLTDDVLRKWTRIVEAHHGRVVDYSGDGVLAVFGADGVREDDAERAVRAGLEIAASTIGDELGPTSHPRVGVHTGPVLLSRGIGARTAIHGAAVNIAARMEQSAPPGRLRISQDCFRLVRGAFDLEAQAPLALKGVGDAVQTWLVVRASTRPFDTTGRGIDGVVTPLVGRRRELDRLRESFARCRERGRLVRVTVSGEAGLGKTRLLADFDRTLDADVTRFFGRTRPHDQDVPYALVRDLVRNHCAIVEADPAEVAWEKLLDVTQPLFDQEAADRSRWIAQMIGVEPPSGLETPWLDARQLRAQAFHATTAMVRRVHERDHRPLAFFLEDLHWADEGSLLFLEHLVEACGDLPILVVGLTRPGATRADAPVATDAGDATTIALLPLSQADRGALADALLARIERPPARLRELLVERSDGNPFFAEELLARLIDQGIVARDGEHWSVDETIPQAVETPSTLAGLIQSRIDSLSAQERRVLQAASVVGHQFWDAAVGSLEPSADAMLSSLVRRDLIVPRSTSTFPGTRAYVFRHHLLHQVTYDTVLRAKRRELHRRAAEWLVASGHRDAFLAQIAEHYACAEDATNAIAYLGAAGDEAARASAYESAARLYGRALEWTPHEDRETRFDLHRRRRNATRGLLKREELAADVAALEALAEELDDDDRRLQAANVRAALELVLGNFAQTRVAALRTAELADAAGTPWRAITARLNWARALLAEGDLAGANRLVEKAKTDYEQSPPYAQRDEDESIVLNLLGILAAHAGQLSLAAMRFEGSRDAARKIGSLSMEGHALANLADLRRHVGRFAEAERFIVDARAALERSGRKTADAHLYATQAQVARSQGRPDLALERLDDAARAMVGSQDRDLEATVECIRGHALVDLGRLDEAQSAYERSLATFEALGRATVVCEPLAGLAAIRLARDDLPGASETIAPILARFERGETIGHVDDVFRIYLDCHRILRRAGDPRARAWLEAGHRELMRLESGLDEVDRASFLANIASHRELLQIWARDTPA